MKQSTLPEGNGCCSWCGVSEQPCSRWLHPEHPFPLSVLTPVEPGCGSAGCAQRLCNQICISFPSSTGCCCSSSSLGSWIGHFLLPSKKDGLNLFLVCSAVVILGSCTVSLALFQALVQSCSSYHINYSSIVL